MDPNARAAADERENAEDEELLVLTGQPASGRLTYIALGTSLFWSLGSAILFVLLLLVVGYVTIVPPGTGMLPQSASAWTVPVMHLAVLLFMLNGSALGAGLLALYAWQWYGRSETRVLTRRAVVWLMFAGPGIAAIVSFAVFIIESANVLGFSLLLGNPPEALIHNQTPEQFATDMWNYLFALAAYWCTQGLILGLAWQGVLGLLVYISRRRVRDLLTIIGRRSPFHR